MNSILLSIFSTLLVNFHSLQIQDVDGNNVNMSVFAGKKILLVNIASGSDRVQQLAELQQLQQTFQDSLVVIAFPSNSFGNEPMTNSQIKNFCQTNYGSTFLIASKNAVSGSGLQAVYSWLFDESQNDQATIAIQGDFQKVLISANGLIKGVYSPKVSPMNSHIIEAINSPN